MANQTGTAKKWGARLLWGSLILIALVGLAGAVLIAVKEKNMGILVGLVFYLPLLWYGVKRFSNIGVDTKALSQCTLPSYIKVLENVTLIGTGTQKFRDSGVDYNYLEFKCEDGQVVTLDDGAHVENKMNMNFEPGVKGNFYFANDGIEMELVASDVNGEKRSVNIPTSFILWFFLYLGGGPPTGNLFLNLVAYTISLGMFLWFPLLKAFFISRRSKRIKGYLLGQGFVV